MERLCALEGRGGGLSRAALFAAEGGEDGREVFGGGKFIPGEGGPAIGLAGVAGDEVEVDVEDGLAGDFAIELQEGEAVALEAGLEEGGHVLNGGHHASEFFGGQMEEVGGVELGDDEGVAAAERINIQEGVSVLVLIDLVGGDFATDNLAENAVAIGGRGAHWGDLSGRGVNSRYSRASGRRGRGR